MNKEILLVVDTVSNEKGVDKDIIFGAVESALAMATKKGHGGEIDVRVAIDRESGDYSAFRRWQVIDNEEEFEFPERQIMLGEAHEKDASQGDVGKIRALDSSIKQCPSQPIFTKFKGKISTTHLEDTGGTSTEQEVYINTCEHDLAAGLFKHPALSRKGVTVHR